MPKKLKIEYVPIESVQTYENNAKKHPAEQVEQIKESIRQFDNNDPIAVWHDPEKDADVIVEGHGRYMALLELGKKEIPIIRLDHLSDEQRKAYALVHNKLTMNSDFDLDLLGDEIDNILDIDMSDFGFDRNDDSYLDDFFERGVEAKEQVSVLALKIVCDTEEQLDSVEETLKGMGLNPERI